MTRYRKKPVEVDAWPVDWIINSARSNNPVFHTSAPFNAYMDGIIDIRADHLSIKTLEGAMRANRGDMLIRGVAGEWYPCKPEIFDATYEQADEDDPADSADFR